MLTSLGPRTRGDGRAADAPATITPSWWIRVLVFLGLFVGAGAIGLGLSFTVDKDGPEEGPGATIFALGLIVAALVAYLFVCLRLERRRPPIELAPSRALGLLSGVVFGSALVFVCSGIIWALGALEVTGHRPANDINWAVDILMTGVLAGVMEEIIFRGILFRIVEQTLGTWAALAVSAILFGALHGFADNATLVSTLATIIEAGLLFAAVYILTRSLWWVIGIHASWNVVVSLVVGSPVSGNINKGLLITNPAGSDLVSGGAYGIEASIVTVIVLGAIAVWGLVQAARTNRIVAPWWVRRRGAPDGTHGRR